MSPKQQAYYLYTSDTIDAQMALRLGMVNEVLPRSDLMPRARAIAARILRMPKLARLMSKQIVRRQLQQRHVQDAGFHLAHELLGFMTNVRESAALTRKRCVPAWMISITPAPSQAALSARSSDAA